MNATTRSFSPPAPLHAPGFLTRLFRLLTGRDAATERPAMRWGTDVKPIDWDGEDTSLTQEHLELLR